MTALFKYRHYIGGISCAENSSRRFNSGRTARFALQTNEVHADSSYNCTPASQATAGGASAPPAVAAQTQKHFGRPRPAMVFDIKSRNETGFAARLCKDGFIPGYCFRVFRIFPAFGG
jgi:hypothetical protein